MGSRLNPYLMLPGTAREAVTFYTSVFGGEVQVSTFGEFGLAGEGVDPDGVMHAQLETPAGYTLMLSDLPPGTDPAPPGGAVTICLSGDDTEQLRGYFTRLAEGGTVSVPLTAQVWGDEYGQVTDRFGVEWMANIATGGS